jgi:hypothetical protein
MMPIVQGRTKWRNCRLTTKSPDFQLSWAILAQCRHSYTHKHNFHLCSENSRNLECSIQLVNNMNDKSTVSPLRSSLPMWIKCSVFVQIRAVCAWYQIKNHVHLSTRPIPWNYEEASQAIWAWWEKIKRSRISWTGRISRYLESIRLLTFMYLWPN